ncbi:hypothetical protein LNP00_05035 [Fructobacillus sp. M158]|uniref:hypothetical protein n=1 Tax=Fructobacillus parabroussonetiae TaxID=2713174 RepID=UPI00200B0282|nr:hypothetical protein [Fructobacillus parabroussonetiae]MCK8617730.1 hypothetical protein [Fructobacillus parabroussonetiae]
MQESSEFKTKELCYRLLIKCSNDEENKGYRTDYVVFIINQTKNAVEPVWLDYIQEALEIVQKLPSTEKSKYIVQLNDIYQNIWQHIGQNMHENKHELTLSDNKQYDNYLSGIKKFSLVETIVSLCQCIDSFNPDEWRAAGEKSVFNEVFNLNVLDGKNRMLYELPPRGEKNSDFKWKLHEFRLQISIFGAVIVKPLIDHLRHFETDELNELKELINASDFVPTTRKEVVFEAFLHSIKDSMYMPITTLTGQFEEAIRQYIHRKGGIYFKIKKDGSRTELIGNSLADESCKYLNEKDGFLVKSLFSKYSINVRNLLAHGDTEPEEAERGEYYAFLAIFLHFIYSELIY